MKDRPVRYVELIRGHPALRRVETRTFDDSDNILVRYVPLDAQD